MMEESSRIFEHDALLSTHQPLGPFRRVGAFSTKYYVRMAELNIFLQLNLS